MTKILIAVDESDEAVVAAESAHRLFGDDASYFVVNVTSGLSSVPFADRSVIPIVPPYTGAMGMVPVQREPLLDAAESTHETGRDVAEREAGSVAADIAEKASLGAAETLGQVGDPADAILEAARTHNIDVIVLGSHDRTWFKRLLSGSVTDQVIKQSTIPVLVVK
jgi:nucleotide-binding universal stress UspA family protein